MNDAELVTSVRESITAVHSTTPVEQILIRGRAVRARRRISGLAGALAVVAGAALAVAALVPSGHQASHQSTARLAAWTVTKLADGNVSVTINQLKDPAGLQSTLRADGVRASVTFADQQNPACQPYPGGTPGSPSQLATPLLKQVFPKPYQRLATTPPQPNGPPRPATGPPPSPVTPGSTLIVIDPSALPDNAGVQLGASFTGGAVLLPSVVYASPQCTGS